MTSMGERQKAIAVSVRDAARLVSVAADHLEYMAGRAAIDLGYAEEPAALYEAIGKLAVAQDALNIALAGYEAP